MKVSRNISAWALVAILFTHALGVNIISSLYDIDKLVFVDLFCENKDKPELNCKGSCMLEKLEKQKRQDSEKPTFTTHIQSDILFYVQNFGYEINNIILLSEVEHHFYFQDFYGSIHLKEVFRPPSLV